MRVHRIVTFFRRVMIGFCIGIGAAAPGVSGGAIAVIFGLYQQITEAISTLFRSFKRSALFLLPLACGAILSVILCGRFIEWGMMMYPLITHIIFIGLMLGTLPSVLRDASRQGIRWWYPLLSVFSLGITVFGIKVFPFTLENAPATFPLYLLCGAIIGIGTIVPGVSTTFTLMALGLYEPVLHAVSNGDWRAIFPLTAGFLLFILLFSKLVNWVYSRAYGAMSFLVIGLLLGSMAQVFPTALLHRGMWPYWLCIVVFFLTSYLPLRHFSSLHEKKGTKA